MAASVGTLKAFLTLDSKGFLGGFSQAAGGTKAFAGSIGGLIGSKLGAIGAGLAAAGASALSFGKVMHSMESIDRQAKLADRLGITNEAVQRLSLAADLAGTDVETLAQSMLKMGKNIGSGGMSLDKRFFQVADSIAKIADPAERAKRALQVFGGGAQGKGAFELINLLAQGGKGIRESANAIDRFGLGISRIDAAKVEAANDALTTMGTVLKGVSDHIAIELSPGITHFVNQWLEGMELIGRSDSVFSQWGTSVSKTIDGVVAGFAGLEAMLQDAAINNLDGTPLANYFKVAQDAYKQMQADRLGEGVSVPGKGLGRLGGIGGGGFKGHVDRPGAFERGSVEAARAIQSSSDKNANVQFDILQQLKDIKAFLDPMKRDARDGGLHLAEVGI